MRKYCLLDIQALRGMIERVVKGSPKNLRYMNAQSAQDRRISKFQVRVLCTLRLYYFQDLSENDGIFSTFIFSSRLNEIRSPESLR